MRYAILLVAGLGLAFAGCEEKKTPSVGNTVTGAMDTVKEKAGSAMDAVMKQKDELIASASTKLADMEKAADGWKAKVEAMPEATRGAVNSLVDTFKSSLTSAKDSVAKLKDATAENFPTLSSNVNDAIKKVTTRTTPSRRSWAPKARPPRPGPYRRAGAHHSNTGRRAGTESVRLYARFRSVLIVLVIEAPALHHAAGARQRVIPSRGRLQDGALARPQRDAPRRRLRSRAARRRSPASGCAPPRPARPAPARPASALRPARWPPIPGLQRRLDPQRRPSAS